LRLFFVVLEDVEQQRQVLSAIAVLLPSRWWSQVALEKRQTDASSELPATKRAAAAVVQTALVVVIPIAAVVVAIAVMLLVSLLSKAKVSEPMTLLLSGEAMKVSSL
jgi:hypothetical protein